MLDEVALRAAPLDVSRATSRYSVDEEVDLSTLAIDGLLTVLMRLVTRISKVG